MNIRKADHMALLVADVERSRRFYTQVLGMQEIPCPKNFNFPGAWMSKVNFEILLIEEMLKNDQKGRGVAYEAIAFSLFSRSQRR